MSTPPHSGSRRIFDLTVNVQSMIYSAIAAALGAMAMWYSLVGRVQTLEEHDKQQEVHFAQIERAIDQQRNDVKEQLRGIGQDVKDTNAKLDQLTQQLIYSAAGNRVGMRGWTR
ncbi:hypothetical protein [Burkholderia multivorans]|uniref:hypothetical protein n=1 Tax=Burkholderia multivorans TaxID=87883 RepID=UPI000277F263|nr:hypothetical protein [Burkholderia multivorans]EJO51062.1 hypothetical protein BURMUCF2_1825 [Burkholderia multivorans CF2]MBJ9658044.1 hypothetical protein [Burkholderia multivorans]MBR7922677.1 hypothetical protein [Burkholderia multivorans]MBU9145424.1 hypothetical protein [Burkholderia multivorans]MBU9473843.1 hypothetical protein [Burkholderia multivorans]